MCYNFIVYCVINQCFSDFKHWKPLLANRSNCFPIVTCHNTEVTSPGFFLCQCFDCHLRAVKELTLFPRLYVLRFSPRHCSRRAIWLQDTLLIFQITSQARGQGRSSGELSLPPHMHVLNMEQLPLSGQSSCMTSKQLISELSTI